MYKRVSGRAVVVGVDGSEGAAAATAWAAEEARRRHCPLRLVWVADSDLPITTARLYPELRAAARQAEQNKLDTVVAEVRASTADVEVDGTLVGGRAAEALLKQASYAELVVLGSRGRGGFTGMLLGSTSLQVAMHAHCPVVVLRSGADTGETGRVVVGVDGSRHADAAVGFAFQEADLRSVGLTAVRTWLAPEFDVEALPPHDWEQAEKDEQARLAEDLQAWRSLFPDVDLIEKTVRGTPAATLIAESTGAELLAVGSHGHDGFGGLVLGSVSHAALHHAHCPVAVIRH